MNKQLLLRLYLGYKAVALLIGALAVGYLMLLVFPGALFAHTVTIGKFEVNSREILDPAAETVFERAEDKLRSSPIYDETIARQIYLTGSHGLYNFLSHKAYNSFGNSVPLVNNVFINRADIADDLVFIRREHGYSRSLSGVVAHETAHLLIRKRYGTVRSMLIPRWKNEGYCEYVAGESTIPLDEGMRRWRENPTDDRGYRFTNIMQWSNTFSKTKA